MIASWDNGPTLRSQYSSEQGCYKPDYSSRINNTNSYIARTSDKFVQAGVGYASLSDNEAESIRPTFPYSNDILSKLASSQLTCGQAKQNKGRCKECSTSKEGELLSR